MAPNPLENLALTTLKSVPLDRQFNYRVLISGYYGFNNIGDELILETLIESLKERGFQITVLSNQPQKTQERFKVKSLHRLNYPDIIDELRQGHLFISGGGGLFQDATGPGSALYYGSLVHMAKFFEVPTFFWGQGMGPLTSPVSRKITASSLEHCRGITLRDEASADLAEQLLAERGIRYRPEVTADPVWALKVPNRTSVRKKYKTWNIGISLRPWKELTPARIQGFARFFKSLTEGSERPVKFFLFPFQPQADNIPLQQFEAVLKQESFKDIHKEIEWVQSDEVVKGINKCHVLFGMRYHCLLLAILARVPVYGLIYDPKVQQLLDRFELEGARISEMESLDEESIRTYFNDYPEINLRELRKRALVNSVRLLEVFQHEVDVNLVGLKDHLKSQNKVSKNQKSKT